MSNVELTQEVIKDLRKLADSMETLIKAVDDHNEASGKEVSLEEVRAILAAKSQAGKQPEVKALISKYGVSKLTDIPPEKYRDLLKDAEGI